MRLKHAREDTKVGYDPTRFATGRATRFTTEREVNASETVKPFGPVRVHNTAARTTTAGVI
jgi:hypothetical protein